MIHPPPVFRPAQATDAPRIADFQLRMAWETERLRLEESVCRAGVQAVFERPALGTYHVCVQDSAVIGSLLITTEWSDWRNGLCWWIQSVFLESGFRGRGYYSQFYAYIRALAQEDPQIKGIRLYVDKSNGPAQNVYAKLGMNGDHYRVYEWMKTF